MNTETNVDYDFVMQYNETKDDGGGGEGEGAGVSNAGVYTRTIGCYHQISIAGETTTVQRQLDATTWPIASHIQYLKICHDFQHFF
jgi:hypothetical protein